MDGGWKTMRLRYAGTCAACGAEVAAGERGHYGRSTRTVRCVGCGVPAGACPDLSAVDRPAVDRPDLVRLITQPPPVVQPARKGRRGLATCADCGRRMRPEDTVASEDGSEVPVCQECVQLDLLHVVGVPGGGARREHARRVQGREARVRAKHPRLGGLLLALTEDPQHTTAWRTGAVGEEQFGHRLSAIAGPSLKVLHDRKRPGSSANIDHVAVTSRGVRVMDAKKHQGKIETRGHGVFSRREPDLWVGSRNQTKAVLAVLEQVAVVASVLDDWSLRTGSPRVPVSGALVFVEGEFGLFASPSTVRGVEVTWGKRVRADLTAQTGGTIPVDAVAKQLAAHLRPGFRPEAVVPG